VVSTYLTENEVFGHGTIDTEFLALKHSVPTTADLFRLSLMLEMVDKPVAH